MINTSTEQADYCRVRPIIVVVIIVVVVVVVFVVVVVVTSVLFLPASWAAAR